MTERTPLGICQYHLIHPGAPCKYRAVASQAGNELQFRLCEFHMWTIGRHSKRIQDTMDRLAKKQRQPIRRRHVRINRERELEGIISARDRRIAALEDQIRQRQEAPAKKRAITDGTLYFLRIGGYVKIGWTSDLVKRMKAYPPDTTLLATQPGTRADEAALHKKFAHLRTHGREWYPLAPQLVGHIERVEREYGRPNPVTFMAKPVSVPMPHRLNSWEGTPRGWRGRRPA